MAKAKTAIVKTVNGEFTVEYLNSRDFVNSVRSAIERGTLWEFTAGNTRTIINCKNIVSIEMETEALGSISPFIQPLIKVKTAEQIREEQLALQPGIIQSEAKKKLMDKLEKEQEAAREAQTKQIYGKE